MPILPSLDTRTVLRSESLSDNPVIKDHDGFKLFKPSMQSFIDLIREKKIKEDSLNKLKEQVKNDAKARRYPNLVEKQAKLNHELDKNQRLLKKEIQTVLDNDLLLMEWRRLPQKSFELIDKQTQLAEDLTEEIINEEQAQKIKSLINAEFDIFYSEPVRELYRRDFQAILDVGISEPVLSYLKELSQLDEVMHLEVKKEIDQYQNEQENLRIEKAERIIAKQAQVSSQWIDSVTHIAEDHLACRNEFDEDKRLPVLYSADSAEAVYELLLNGADPVQESKNLDSTPLTQHFASRYVIEQELNRVEHIDIPLLKIQLDSKFDENQLSEKFLEQKKQLKIDLQDKIERLTAEIELQPEFKIEIENQIQELKQETKELKLKLKTDLPNQIKQSKKKVKELPPKLKVELTNQIKILESEANGLKLELKNNAALIDVHIKAILLRDTDAQVFDYPDVAHKKRFYETWNNCKREIKELQQTQLTENCTAYNFLTEDLAKLPTIEAKALKSSIKHFPEYRPLLQMQNGLLNNYQLVQGPRPVKATTEVRLPSISNHLLKDSASESKSETPIVLPTIETSEVNGQSQRFSPKKSYSRLNNSVFFGGSLQAKSESVSEKTSERNSRLNGSLFFAMAKAPSDLNVAKEKSIDRTIYIPDSVKLV